MKPKFNKRRFTLRLIVLPILILLLTVTFSYKLIQSLLLRTFNFLMYGGEFVTYGEDLQKDTIDNLLKQLANQNLDNGQNTI